MIKSSIVETIENKKGITYPCVMKDADSEKNGKTLIVLFTDCTCGIVLYSEYKSVEIGDKSNDWDDCEDEKYWIPFKGEIKLKNG